MLKELLDNKDADAVATSSEGVREISRAARGSKTRRFTATRALLMRNTAEADAQVEKWMYQKDVESVMRGVRALVELDENVDRLAEVLDGRLKQGLNHYAWVYAMESLSHMRRRDALGYFMDEAFRNRDAAFGVINALARGGDLHHEAARIERFVHEAKPPRDMATTKLWVRAKIGDARAYDDLVELVQSGPMDADHAMRAAQALSHIHKWGLLWGERAVVLARAKLKARGDP